MRPLRTLFLTMFLCAAAQAATTINVGSNVVVSQVKRFGISGISHYYYDRLLLKNLVWHNAGFEGLLFQSVMRCDSGLTATGCVDTNPFASWPTGFWNGASYEFILGTAKGRIGTVASSTAPPAARTSGTTWVFSDSGTAPAQGDYFIARRYSAGGAEIGWSLFLGGGATVSTETADLPPATDGRQCLRVSAAAAGQNAQVTSPFGFFQSQTWIVLNGSYRLSFKAKGLSGSNSITASVTRASTQLATHTFALSPAWSTYTYDFSAAETGIPTGFVNLAFNIAGSSVLLDDVSLVQTNGDPTNTTAFRDPVIAALRSFNPGILRSHNLELGESLDNMLAPPFGRMRTEFHASATDKATMQYDWHEFLEMCEAVGAEPYIDLPMTFSETEMRNLLEYLGGPTTSPYGARRAARGHPTPWTSVFPRMHLELGNEPWNSVFLGATLFAADYGRRGNDVFAAARNSPYYTSKYNLILGVQAANPFNSRVTHNASANHDMLAVAPYMATEVNDFADNEQLFGSLFAEASFWSIASNGPVKQTYDFINATARPVPMIVYEVNLHTTRGSITQPALDSFVPSAGAGLAVADHMLNMLRETKMRDQLLFSLGGYRYDRDDGKGVLIWGVTRDMGVTDRKRPQFLAVKLANEALSGDLVQVTQSGDNPTWNQPLTNRIQMDNVPYLQTFAFVNGNRRALIVFNLHRTSPLDVTFTGANAPRGAVTLKRLTSGAITNTNESAESVTIATQAIANLDPAQPMTLPPFSMTLLVADAPATPSMTATATSATAVGVSWSAVGGAASYEIMRTADNVNYESRGSVSGTAFSDSAQSGTAYLYKVRAIDALGVVGPDSPRDLATTVIFADDPLTPGPTIIRAVHITQARTAVAAVRTLAGLSVFSFTNPTITPGNTVIAAHIGQLRTALDAGRSALGLSALSYTDPTITPGATRIKAAHLAEVRAGVK